MSNFSSQSSSNELPVVVIEILPVEEEKGDRDTQAIALQTRVEIQQEIEHYEKYTLKVVPDSESEQGSRAGFDMFLLVSLIGVSIATYKDLLTSIFTTISTTIELLAKHGRVQEIEIIVGGKTIILHDVSKKTAKELIAAIEAKHPDVTETLTPGTTAKVKAKVSRKRRRS